jgi:cytidine deaminase
MLKTRPSADELKLHARAEKAMQGAYAIWSDFTVGAAVRCADSGSVYTGANVENDSYGLTNCAERTAIFTAVAAGCRRIEAVAIAGTAHTLSPCGACRQVIAQFGAPDARVIFPRKGKLAVMTIEKLLPVPFELEPEPKNGSGDDAS